MARHSGKISWGSGFNITAAAPIDSRMMVDTVDDLYKASTWPKEEAPIYNGMTVTVIEDGCIYTLVDSSKYNIAPGNPGSGWRKLSTTNEISKMDIDMGTF